MIASNWFSGSVWKRRHINQILKRATRGVQRRLEVFERQLDLAFEVGLRRSIGTAADLTGDEEKIA